MYSECCKSVDMRTYENTLVCDSARVTVLTCECGCTCIYIYNIAYRKSVSKFACEYERERVYTLPGNDYNRFVE